MWFPVRSTFKNVSFFSLLLDMYPVNDYFSMERVFTIFITPVSIQIKVLRSCSASPWLSDKLSI